MAQRKGFSVVDGQVDPTVYVHRPTSDERRGATEAADELCERLVAIAPEMLKTVPMTDIVREALDLAREVRTHGARRRQLLYLAKLLRAEDLDAIEDALAAGLVSEFEVWRDRMLDEGDQAVMAFVDRYPRADRQRLRHLMRHARKTDPSTPRGERAREAVLGAIREEAQS